MKNNSKNMLKEINITYKELAFLLKITERQAMNILNKDNKSLYNYLAIEFLSGKEISKLWELDENEIKEIKKRVDALKSTL